MPRKSKNSRKTKSRPQQSRSLRPPVIPGNTTLVQRLRFTPSSNLTNYPVSPINMMQALGILATSSSLGYALFGSFRVLEVEMWTCQIPTSGSPLATCAVSFPLGSSFQSNKEFSDSSLSSAVPAHLRVRPPGNEYAAFWQTYTSTAFMAFSCTQNSIIDVVFECVIRDGTASIPSSISLLSATAGSVYYAALDGIGGVIIPVSRATIWAPSPFTHFPSESTHIPDSTSYRFSIPGPEPVVLTIPRWLCSLWTPVNSCLFILNKNVVGL